MEKILEFFMKHGTIIIPAVLFLVGVFIPKEKVFSLGNKASTKIPKNIAVKLAEYMDAFEQGLIGATYNGDKSIVSNDQITESVKKIKVDLGLDK
jgi:hypothetical protein